MAGTFKVRINGLKEVQRALQELPKATARNVMRRVLKERAEPFAETARQLVPVHRGTLKRSIGVSTVLSKSQRRSFKKEDRNDVVVYVGPGAHPHAHMQEFGTSDFQAQPYMRPAWEQNKEKVFDNIVDDMWKEIKKAAERRARKLAKSSGKV